MTTAVGTAKRVLMVDDEPKFCQTVGEFLRLRGYEVTVAGNASEALLELDQVSPDVVLLDIRMPGLSGLEALKAMRSRFHIPRVIIISAADTEETVQEALRLGAQAFMCKPVDFRELERLISGIWPSTPA
ncbi:MAG: response regulator [Candidatus Omnitrophica bacterium]|nr:response regulator [Candidatus Omnitrophota bacterium]